MLTELMLTELSALTFMHLCLDCLLSTAKRSFLTKVEMARCVGRNIRQFDNITINKTNNSRLNPGAYNRLSQGF